MANATLTLQLRDTKQKAKVLRRQSIIPAEFYGHGVDNMSLQMDYQTFRRLFRKVGENSLVDLKVEGGEDRTVLVHRVDYHSVTGEIDYVEFINVRMDEKVTTHVAITLEGQAPAVKELAGSLLQNLDELEIRCLPNDLIHGVTLDVSSLDSFHAALHVSDIVVPETVEVLTPAETTVATVTPPRAEETEQAAEVDVASVGVAGEEAKAEGEEEAS